MSFKETKTYNEFLKIVKISIIIVAVSAILVLINGLIWKLKFLEIIMYMIGVILGQLIFFILPVSLICLGCTAIEEFVKNKYKTPKTLLKIYTVNLLPVSLLAILFFLSNFFDSTFGPFAGISYGIGIPCYAFLFFSIPLSIIFLICAIVEDLKKKFKK